MILQQLVEQCDIDRLQQREHDIAMCIEYEVQREDPDPELYLIYWISQCPEHYMGRIMFQICKQACNRHSQYHWCEIMKVIGQPMMVGAVMSRNIKLLEHAMAHVDEIHLERLLTEIKIPEIDKWYEENFVKST